MSAPAILPDARAQWLARRRELVTASDIAAIIGEDPRRGPLAVWASKVHGIEPDEQEAMIRGRDFEESIARAYHRQTGRSVGALPEYEIAIHPAIPWIGATLDRKVMATKAKPDPFGTWDDGSESVPRARAPLQLKMSIGSAKDWKGGEVPLGYQVQCQVEAACADSTWAAIAALIGPGPLATADLVRDDAFLLALIPALEKFRWHVERRIPPEADAKLGTTAALRLLWPSADGATIPLDAEAGGIMDDLESARARVAAAKETERTLLNKLHVRMAGASYGALLDGSYVHRARIKRDSYEVAETSYVTLRRWRPRLRRR